MSDSYKTYQINPNKNQRSVTLPKNTIELKNQAFQSNKKLINISFNEKLSIIDQESFKDCTHLEKVYFPYKTELMTIPESCFENCYNLKYISIPNSLDYINSKAFKNCTNIDVLTIPKKIVSIDHDAFEGWTSKQEIIIYKDYGKFINCDAKISLFKDNDTDTLESLQRKETGQRYFAVTCKCGHVSRKYYMPITFGIVAKNRKEASRIARKLPRVKHNHKYAIIDNKEISFIEYKRINEQNKYDPYLNVQSNYQQKEIMDSIEGRLVLEDKYKSKHSKNEVKPKVRYHKKEKIRNYKKFMNMKDMDEDSGIQ